LSRAAFLDRDGTINEDVGHIIDPGMFQLIPEAVDAMKDLREAGFILPLITNQAGVAHGLMTEQHLKKVLTRFESILKEEGTYLDGVYYCPHHPEEGIGAYKRECDCRKPGSEMLTRAADNLGINLSVSYMIGDHWTDVQAGIAAGCKAIMLRTGHGPQEIAKLSEDELSKAAFVAEDLRQAADWILDQEV
jgi:D-glycero-D-manno-heptose 1,7-bisphosphate phosphatase